jgi:hypothetical protein
MERDLGKEQKETADDFARPTAGTKERPRRPCVGGESDSALLKASIENDAPTELVSVEQMILHEMRVVANHGLHRDKLGGGQNVSQGGT